MLNLNLITQRWWHQFLKRKCGECPKKCLSFRPISHMLYTFTTRSCNVKSVLTRFSQMVPSDYKLSIKNRCHMNTKNNLKFFYIYLFLRERDGQSTSRGVADRERDTESKAGSRLWASGQHRAWCGAQTHELWDCDLSRSRTLNRLSHPGTPILLVFKVLLYPLIPLKPLSEALQFLLL